MHLLMALQAEATCKHTPQNRLNANSFSSAYVQISYHKCHKHMVSLLDADKESHDKHQEWSKYLYAHVDDC